MSACHGMPTDPGADPPVLGDNHPRERPEHPGAGEGASTGPAAGQDASGADGSRLDEIAALIGPGPPPQVLAGYDLCPCGRGGTWPCPVTRAAWLARRLDPVAEPKRILGEIVRGADPDLEDDPW